MIRELADKIADEVFSIFDAPNDKCQRLAAKGGKYPDEETNLGGLCKEALSEHIEKSLRKWL